MEKTELVLGAPSVWAYGYDAAGRLATVDRDGVQVSAYAYL